MTDIVGDNYLWYLSKLLTPFIKTILMQYVPNNYVSIISNTGLNDRKKISLIVN